MTASFADQSLTAIDLNLLHDPDSTVSYTITVGNIYDCPGNSIQHEFSSANLKLDAQQPKVLSVYLRSSISLDVIFSESITKALAEDISNYETDKQSPHTASLSPDKKTVTLVFSQSFKNGVANILRIKNVTDLAGNSINAIEEPFMFFQPITSSFKDIIITEIFADPTPQITLPEAEFIEIYNRSDNPFDLKDWTLSDGVANAVLSQRILLPDEYLVICTANRSTLFSSFGKTMGTGVFPSLNNTGDALVLKDSHGLTIDSVNYSDRWYQNDEKKDGGWTLEIIDPENFCKGNANWTASIDPAGGTPGHQNSVYTIIPDHAGPKLLRASVVAPKTLTLEFDEKLSAVIPSKSSFLIEPPIEILTASFADQSLTAIDLNLLHDPDSTVSYTITVGNIYDCPGNSIQHEFSSANLKLDAQQPKVLSVYLRSSTSLDVIFSESITKALAEDRSNYETDKQSPHTASLSPDKKTVTLVFSQSFKNGVANILRIKNVTDLAGNSINAVEEPFMFFQPITSSFKDIIITEIFADPTPQITLPEAEFIEIYNRSDNPFDLKDWTLSDGVANAVLSQRILLPDEYLVICAATRASLFSSFGKTMGTSIFPSLNNTGDPLVLKDSHGLTIDSVNYSDRWYKDDEKKDGGWTLELIDPMNICSESENWIASEDERGGTPGVQNSVFAKKPDLTGPKLVSAIPLSASQIVLRFDEKLQKILPDADQFAFSPLLKLIHISFADPSLTVLHLSLEQPLEKSIEYHLSLDNIFDCAGNKIQDGFREIRFALPEEADSLDLVINEILFNPRSTGVDFVEVYNRSSKFINLKNFILANRNEDGELINGKNITEENALLKPQQFIVFTENANVLKGEYLQGKEEIFFKVDLPSFPDDEGSVVLTDSIGNVIDALSYSDKMHSVFVKESEGVSLERISMETPTDDVQNWKSASSVSGYATPGYRNSNSIASAIMNEAVIIEPEIFIPLYGQPDFTQINYQFDRGGYVANVKIFDPHGREIKQLANNEILGSEGFFRWDGDEDRGGKARIGSYMIWFEVFDDKGTVQTFRKRVVIADNFSR